MELIKALFFVVLAQLEGGSNLDTATATIIVAVLGFVGNLIGSALTNNKTEAVMQEQIKEVKNDIGTLSTRVDKHNNLVERMVVVEQSTKSAHHRIDRMERKEENEQ